MNIIFVRKHRGHSGHVTLGQGSLAFLSLFALLVLPVALIYGGYWFGSQGARFAPDELHTTMRAQLNSQQKEVTAIQQETSDNVNALASQLGQMQSHVIRLNALGERLTKVAKLEKGEFDFAQQPAQGGPANPSAEGSVRIPDFVAKLELMSLQLDNREQQLVVLEEMLMNRNLDQEVRPAGRPITKGWLSSYFGVRTDPFTGRPDYHQGLDFAGKDGGDVIAVAAGVVTWASDRYGYGNLVEINHGKGYTTRYGHNKEIIVKVGDTVKKGDVVAHIGSTGRSTGPHVHFEVLVNGHPVNPLKYVRAK